MDRALELVDVRSVLQRHKRLFWVVTAAVVGVGVLATVFVPVKYESQAAIAIGQISQSLLEPAGILVQRLKHEYRVDDDYDPPGARLVRVVNDVRDAKEVVVLLAHASTATEAQSFLKTVISTSIAPSHDRVYETFVAGQNSRIAHLTQDLAQIRLEIDRLQAGSRQIARTDAAASALMIIERARLISEQSGLEMQKAALQIGLLPPYSEPTRVLREPTLAQRPSQPRRVLYIALAVVLGPLLGFIGVFFAHTVGSSAADKNGLREDSRSIGH